MKVYLIFLAILFSQVSFGQDLNIQIIESQGFSVESLFRGVIGMASLIFIAFLLSNNRKAINWKLLD